MSNQIKVHFKDSTLPEAIKNITAIANKVDSHGSVEIKFYFSNATEEFAKALVFTKDFSNPAVLEIAKRVVKNANENIIFAYDVGAFN